MAFDPNKLLERAARRGRQAASRAKDGLIARVSSSLGRGSRYREGDSVPIHFANSQGGEVPYGTTILAAARTLRVDLDHFCGGHCSCGTCRIEVVSGAHNLSKRLMNEEIVLGVDAARRGDRLACQAQIQGPVEVKVPEFFLVR